MGKQDRIYQEKETQEATAAGGGASTGAFSGTFMQPIRREMPEGLNLPKKPIPQYATIMYRDGGNYKSFFLVELPIELYQRINFTDNGEVIPTEFEIEDFGIDPETLWNSTGSDYDEELDHNLVDVIDVHNDLPDNGLIELSEGLNLPKHNPNQTEYYVAKIDDIHFRKTMSSNEVLQLAQDVLNSLNDPNIEPIDGINDAIDFLYDVNYMVAKIKDVDRLSTMDEGLNLPKKRSVETFKIYHFETNEFVIEVNRNELDQLIDDDWVWYNGTQWMTFTNAMILSRQVELYQDHLKEGLNLAKKQFKQYYVHDAVVGENFVTDEDGVIARAVELRRQYGDLDDPSEGSLNDIDEAIDYLYSYNYKVDKYTGQDLINDVNEGLNLPKRRPAPYTKIEADEMGVIRLGSVQNALDALMDGHEVMVKGYGDDWENYTGIYKEDYEDMDPDEILNDLADYDDFQLWVVPPLSEGLNLPKKQAKLKQYLVTSPHDLNFKEAMTPNELIDFAEDEQISLHRMNPRVYPSPNEYKLDTDNAAMNFLNDYADYSVIKLFEGLNLVKKVFEPLNWHVTYDELRKLNLSVEELEEICNHYGISTIQSNGNGPTDYHWTLEELVDYFQQNTNDYREFMAMRQQPLESEMDEGTDIGLVGAGGHGSGFAYIDPYGKGHKTRGTWAKNEASMYHKRKPYWPGGSFVTVKKKCQKFPYCNQGDTGALNFSNPKAARSQSLREGLNLPKKLKSDYTISVNVEEFNLHRGEYSFIYEETIPAPFGDLEDVKHLCNQMLKRVAKVYDAFNVEDTMQDVIYYAIVMEVTNNDGEQAYYESSLPYGFDYRLAAETHANSILAEIANMNMQNKQPIHDNYNKFDDIYLKHKIMGTAQRLKEYETKLFKGLLKENILGPQRQQPIGDETDLIRDLDAMGGETQLDEVGTDIPVTDMDVSSIALELKDKLPPNPTEMDLFDGLCDIGYCGKDVGEIFNEVMQELVNMGINITMSEGKKKGKWMQKVKDDIEERGTEGKCTPTTKPGCTGKAKVLAKTFKNIAKKKDQNMKTEKTKKHESISHQVFKRIMNENEYRMVGDNIQHLKINYNSDGSVASARVDYLPNAVNNKTAQQELIPIPIGDAGNALLKQYQPYLGNKTSVNETATPGITMYDKIHGESGTANKAGIKRSMDNAKRLNTVADQTENEKLSGIGKGEPKYGNFDKDKKEYDDDYISILRGMGLQDLQFDSEPAKDFKERAEEAIVGSARMGNNPDWANAQRDFDGTKGELGEKIIATAKKKREKIDVGKKDNEKWSISTRYPDISHSQTHIATEGKSFQNLKTKKVIYFQKDLDNLIPETHKVEGAKFKLFDGKKTVYDLKWEGGTIVIENETNKTLVESERNLFKKMSGYSVGQYKVKPKGYLTSKP